MEQLIRFEQFYYTNYGQGYRFEGDSTGSRQVQNNMELLAHDWTGLDVSVPVEYVTYNSQLHSYVAAMVRPCTEVGDSRVSYWIHGVMPTHMQDDGFMACLSWPLADYQMKVVQKAELAPVTLPVQSYDLQAICRRYGLTGQRLTDFMYMVLQTVCGRKRPSTLYFLMEETGASDYNRTAREVMAVVYSILPEPLRTRADYQAYAASDVGDCRFVFRKNTNAEWYFGLGGVTCGAALAVSEEERHFMDMLSELYWEAASDYSRVLRMFCHDDTECFEDIVWNYYLECMNHGERLSFSQETFIRCQSYLEQRSEESENYRRLLCQCLYGIDTKGKPESFVRTVMEKYILAAAALRNKECPEYEESFRRVWQLLDQLRAGGMAMVESYPEWIRRVSPVYYQRFLACGLADGRMSYEQLLQFDEKSMDMETQQLWLQTMAGHISDDASCVGDSDAAVGLLDYIANMGCIVSGLQEREAKVHRYWHSEDAGHLTTILTAISRFWDAFDLKIAYSFCIMAKYLSNMDFESLSEAFWDDRQADSYGALYALGRISEIFKGCRHPNFYNYRLYARYRAKCRRQYEGQLNQKDMAYFEKYCHALRGAYEPAIQAIWDYWRTHSEADSYLMRDILLMLMDEGRLMELIREYGEQGADQAERAAVFLQGEPKGSGRSHTPESDFSDKLPWVIAAGIGLYMGLLVNGWYMTVHLAKLLRQPALVWAGIAGIAVLTGILMLLAEKLLRNTAVSVRMMPWAGLWLFINLILSYFIGNKITAAITAVILTVVYIWLRIKKHL